MNPQGSLRFLPAVTLALLASFAPALRANPTGATVVSGTAAITQNGTTLNVVNSNGAIINWQDFSIGAGEITNFLQPSAASSVLNRVVGPNLSAIYGTLQSNGSVYLINPNGVLIGASGVVNTGSFTASTLDIADTQFAAGGPLTFMGASHARVRNLGAITADGGNVFLIAEHVRNAGTLTAASGTVGLYAGESVTLTTGQPDSGNVAVTAASLPNGAHGVGVNNSGLIQAVQAELKATGNMYTLAINNTGVIKATGATVGQHGVVHFSALGGVIRQSGTIVARNADGSGGDVKLETGAGGTTEVSGRIDAAGTAPGTKGGSVEVTGQTVALQSGAMVDVSGPAGGGTALIGGDSRGANPEVYDAETVTLDHGAVILADATVSGDGGKVVLFSDGATSFQGAISATGADGGAGGSVETSGETLDIGGSVTLGSGGSWLLDPTNIVIDATAAAAIDAVLNGGSNVTEQTTSTPPYGVLSSGVGDITVAAAIDWSGSGVLSLTAADRLAINASITHSGNNSGGLALLSTYNYTLGYGASINLTSASTLIIQSSTYTIFDSFSDLVSGISSNTHVALGSNVTAGTYATSPISSSSATFDGLGHTISNLTIQTDASAAYIGLIGLNYGAISNLALTNETVTVTPDVNTGSLIYVGGLIGYNFGPSITNVAVSGSITGKTAVGGLFGKGAGNVSDSSFSGLVASYAGGTIGGLIGYDGGAVISNSYATGSVTMVSGGGIGGLVGYAQTNTSTIATSYASNTLSAPSGSSVGGLIGENDGTGNIASSYWNTTFNPGLASGSGIGDATGSTALTTTQMSSSSNFTGFNFATTWTIQAGDTSPYLVNGLQTTLSTGGNVTPPGGTTGTTTTTPTIPTTTTTTTTVTQTVLTSTSTETVQTALATTSPTSNSQSQLQATSLSNGGSDGGTSSTVGSGTNNDPDTTSNGANTGNDKKTATLGAAAVTPTGGTAGTGPTHEVVVGPGAISGIGRGGFNIPPPPAIAANLTKVLSPRVFNELHAALNP